MKRFLPVALLLVSLGATGCARAGEDLAGATVVVYNRAQNESAGLARFYAAQRHIPNDHLIGLDCSTEEEISRQEYDDTIAGPLRKAFAERKWWSQHDDAHGLPEVESSQIKFVALVRGVPLKIRATVAYPGDQPEKNQLGSQNAASVDSELAQLASFSHQISRTGRQSLLPKFPPDHRTGRITASPRLPARRAHRGDRAEDDQ